MYESINLIQFIGAFEFFQFDVQIPGFIQQILQVSDMLCHIAYFVTRACVQAAVIRKTDELLDYLVATIIHMLNKRNSNGPNLTPQADRQATPGYFTRHSPQKPVCRLILASLRPIRRLTIGFRR